MSARRKDSQFGRLGDLQPLRRVEEVVRPLDIAVHLVLQRRGLREDERRLDGMRRRFHLLCAGRDGGEAMVCAASGEKARAATVKAGCGKMSLRRSGLGVRHGSQVALDCAARGLRWNGLLGLSAPRARNEVPVLAARARSHHRLPPRTPRVSFARHLEPLPTAPRPPTSPSRPPSASRPSALPISRSPLTPSLVNRARWPAGCRGSRTSPSGPSSGVSGPPQRSRAWAISATTPSIPVRLSSRTR
jgi:hypothetical protein